MDIREVIFRIEHERKEQNAIYHSAAAKFGLTDTALWVLYCISGPLEDQTQQDLCRRGCYAKQTINTAITGLAGDGTVELIPIPGTRNHKKYILLQRAESLRTGQPVNLKHRKKTPTADYPKKNFRHILK